MNAYELSLAYEEVEDKILKDLKKTLEKYTKNQDIAKMTKSDWAKFQKDALLGLKEFQEQCLSLYVEDCKDLRKEEIEEIKRQYRKKALEINKELEELAKDGVIDSHKVEIASLNTKKLKALLNETNKKTSKLQEYAILRSTSDKYKKIIMGAQLYMNSGASTLWGAVDMATMDFLQSGITTIEYKNGANVNIASYSEMALRTADARAQNQADADVREEWDIEPLVLCSEYGACSPTCLPWQGRVYIDDVYGSPTKKMLSETQYERLSVAIGEGLFHPNCRHTLTTWFDGYSEKPKEKRTDKEISENYKAEQKQRGIEREIRKQKRLRDACLTDEAKKQYDKRIRVLDKKMSDFISTTNDKAGTEILRRDRAREVNRFKARTN